MIHFSEHLIMDGYEYAYGLSVADIDGDGHPDIVSANAHRGLYWFANDGRGNFTRHVIQRGPRTRLERMACADLTGTGFPDIVIVDNYHGDILLFKNPGDPRRDEPWENHYIAGPTTHLIRTIEIGAMPFAYDVCLADFDGDGDLDVAASSYVGGEFGWFENTEGDWVKHSIDSGLGETRTLRVADFDGDGRPDLLGTCAATGKVLWYQNPADPRIEHWKKHVIDETTVRPTHGMSVDMDGDGDPDVVMASGMFENVPGMVLWYESDRSLAEGPWQKHIICDNLPQAFEAFAADLDGDRNIEVVVTSWGESGGLFLFKHEGDPRGPWRKQILKEGWVNANQVIVADLNGDGRLDILAGAERGSNELRWWQNQG